MKVVQLVQLEVEGEEYEGHVEDPKTVALIQKASDAYEKALEGLHAALTEAGVSRVYRDEPVSARPAAKKKDSTGPVTAEVRAWAVQNGLTVPDRGRLKEWVNEAFTQKLSGDALKKWVKEHQND
ncbi:Lsr2 family DNA-binding protein [Streptomyces antarcticus]|uniref:Lsr2 family DNA-binding protein n=1 Tax=Streptomyces antarcticus TaxID=2996458 RepID=UPI0022712AD2|nr:histone-like nucleoid-structuring protein Lsr2 [Streptomyces sp. H34-AA3]MCY0945347.1 Lsr2 family protein [Streptomyces sp. H34-AA3]